MDVNLIHATIPVLADLAILRGNDCRDLVQSQQGTCQRVLGQRVTRLKVTISIALPYAWDVFVSVREAAGRTHHLFSLMSSTAAG